MKTALSLLLIVLLGAKIYGQTLFQKELVKLEELSFNSSLEQQAFYDYFIRENKDYFTMFECLSPEVTEIGLQSDLSRFTSFLEKLMVKKKKNPKKKIELIHRHINNSFLKTFEADKTFSDIFKSGLFNQVSGSALYALAFDYYQIPYKIKETPGNLFVIAYSDSIPITVEIPIKFSGDSKVKDNSKKSYTIKETPDNVFIIEHDSIQISFENNIHTFTDDFKKSYVNNLLNQNFISTPENKLWSVDSLFNKYFYSQEEMGIHELVGIHYLNNGIAKSLLGEYRQTLAQFEKAYLFIPQGRVAYLTFIATLNYLRTLNYNDQEYIPVVLKLTRYGVFGITNDEIVSEFNNLTSHFLAYNGLGVTYDSVYTNFMTETLSQEIRSEISFIYNFEKGRYWFSNGQADKALQYGKKANDLKPDDIQSQQLLINLIGQEVSRSTSSQETLDILADYSTRYEGLSKDSVFKTLLLNSYLYHASELFIKNMEGTTYLKKFESIYGENPELNIEGVRIVRAYADASIFYFRKGQRNEALKFLDKGLKYVPNDRELAERKRMIH